MTSENTPQPESKRSNLVEHYGVSGSQEFSNLREAERRSREAAEASPDDEELADRLELAKLKLELFSYDHDNAGAFKFNRFGRELRGLFNGPEEGEGLKLTMDGRVEIMGKAADRRLLAVNMAELDRFNAEGGHRAGDAALKATAHAIEETVVSVLPEGATYGVFRLAGNEFLISVEGVGDDEDAARIEESLGRLRPTVPGISEGAPLSIARFDLAEAVDMVRLPSRDVRNADEANRETVEMVRRLGGFLLEAEKFRNRAERVRVMLSEKGRDGTAKFFDAYLAKAFKGSGLETLADIEKLAAEGTAGKSDWDEVIERLALEAARQRFGTERELEDVRHDIIERRLQERATPSIMPPPPTDDHFAEVPLRTAGQVEVETARELLEQVADGDSSETRKDVARYKLLREEARRDLFQKEPGRYSGTGLLLRGPYYARTQEALKEAGRETSVVFVDMGFLKYFDQKGGRDVGDAALKVAADVLEQALTEAGVEGEAYRYGGDEFTIRIDGGQAEAEKVASAVQRLKAERGRINRGKRSSDEYAPTELSFNYGICNRSLMEKVFADLKEVGYYDEGVLEGAERTANAQAELMTVIADKSLEEQKARDRFALLVEKLRDPAYGSDATRRSQVDSLVSFSAKGIFSEQGGAEFLKLVAEDSSLIGNQPGEPLNETIREFVQEKIRERSVTERERRDRMDQLVDLHVQIHRLSERLDEMESRSDLQAHEIGRLRRELDAAHEERRRILESRRSVDEAA
jgi:GGDEF domain-containing protein